MFILQDFFFISSAFLSKSSGDCMYESREGGRATTLFWKPRSPWEQGWREAEVWIEVWLILVWLGGGVVVWLENYKQQQQQQRLFVLYESKEIHRI